MKAIGRLLMIALLAACVPIASAAGGGSTARLALPTAVAAAKKWQPDAVLTSVSTLGAMADGKSARWDYMFHSPKAGKACTLTFSGDKLAEQMEVRPHVTDAVVADFVDSDKAMAAAKANGVDTKGQPFAMSLSLMGQMTKKPGSYWTVGGGFTTGAVAVIVDAKTGGFEYKQQVP